MLNYLDHSYITFFRVTLIHTDGFNHHLAETVRLFEQFLKSEGVVKAKVGCYYYSKNGSEKYV